MNIAKIEMQLSDLVNEPFELSEFAFKFIEIFNPPKATLTKLRKGSKGKDTPNGELLWPRKLHFRAVEPGQAANTIDALKEQKIARNKAPRFLIATDGKELSAFDSKADESLHCDFSKVNDHFGKMVKPREWFLLPIEVISEAISRLQDGSIINYGFDADRGMLVEK